MKKASIKEFTCGYIKTFSASTVRYMNSAFFGKIGGCVLQGFNLIKMLVHHRLFSQKNTRHLSLFILFKTAGFQRMFQKESVVVFLIAKSQPEHSRFVTILKETPCKGLPEKIPNFCNQLFSVRSTFVLKKKIAWKIITWQLSIKPRKSDNSPVSNCVLLNVKHLLEGNCRNRTVHLLYRLSWSA